MQHLAVISLLAAGSLAGCVEAQPGEADFRPTYKGVDTRLLEGDLVSFVVEMDGARSGKDVADYAECAAAQYTLIRGYGFARHIRTNVEQTGGTWRADGVYTISPALPRGALTIDAEVVVEHCAENGIPTV